jgi:hypothetical protein
MDLKAFLDRLQWEWTRDAGLKFKAVLTRFGTHSQAGSQLDAKRGVFDKLDCRVKKGGARGKTAGTAFNNNQQKGSWINSRCSVLPKLNLV